jgi:hypothetical protein
MKRASKIRRLARRIVPRFVRRRLRPLLGRPVLADHQSPADPLPARPGRKGPNEPGGIRRVHAGSGPLYLFDDWWNVDIRGFKGVDEVVDMAAPWPWRDLDYVYGEHFLEHLSVDQAIRFLSSAATALGPTGRIRLSTPGLEWVWCTHFDPNGPPEKVVRNTYATNRAFHGWGHIFLYSRPMIEHILPACGFADLTFHAYGESEHPALRGLERHRGWEVVDGWPSVWIVEARPTGAPMSTAMITEEAEEAFERYRREGH